MVPPMHETLERLPLNNQCFFLPTLIALCLLMSSAVITYDIVILTDRPSLLVACSGAR
jgi:hypothetical protein